LIKTKSGNVFPKSATDWQWWNTKVPGRLKELNAEGYVQTQGMGLVGFI
jgi:bifunctional polynucleotide phosphatase/kinase